MLTVRRLLAQLIAGLTILIVIGALNRDVFGPIEALLALIVLGFAAMLWPRSTTTRP